MRPGSVIDDRFEIERFAGRGGMGAVYRAVDRARRVPVAVKMLGSVARTDLTRFAREAQILAELRHPGIVRYVAHGETGEGQPYLAMEWLEGVDLDEHLGGGPLDAAESVTLARNVADALGAAHRLGVVHRDIKPSNLFLQGGAVDRVKLLDFGIARSTSSLSMTRTGLVVGTPGYISPEQARGVRAIDARADVFALGCVLFSCLTARPAFLADDVISLLAKVIVETAPRVSELWPEVPPGLDALIARMTALDPEARPRDGAEVARALEALGPMPSARSDAREPRAPALTTSEQRLFCVILIAGDADPGGLSLDFGVTPSSAESAETRRIGEQVTIAVGETIEIDRPARAEPTLREIVARFRGQLAVLAGGARLVTIEASGIATDHAAIAARCALALRERLGRAPMVLATGRAFTVPRTLTGDVVDRAARLLHAAAELADDPAKPRPILLDDATHGLLGERFVVEKSSDGPLLRGERDTQGGARNLQGKATPCVGRDREISTLQAILDECTGEPVARVALLTGPAGAGKSRIRHELERRLRKREGGVTVWIGRGDAMSAGAPLDLLAQVIRGAAGLSGAEPPGERRARIGELAARRAPAADAARMACFLGEIAGAPFPSDESRELAAARGDVVLLGDQMRRAFEDLVAGACAEAPLLLVLEDLHWGDVPSVRFVDSILRNLAAAPLFVLATARPEVHQLFPALWHERSVQEIRVGALTPKASEKLVRHVLGDSASRDTVDRIVARAAGHALHLEEILRAVLEGGGDDALPDTVLAMVQARIEALGPEARRLLRAASVFGRAFWASGVEHLLGKGSAREAREWLDELAAREWIVRVEASRFPGDDEYAFRQDVVREAAYAMLTHVDRALGHRLAGAWLDAAGEDAALILARHFELGGDPPRAAQAYRRAAEQSLEGDDFAAAIEHGERAAQLGAEGAALGQARAILAEAHLHRGEFEAARAHGGDALSLVPRDDPAWSRAACAITHAAGKLGDLPGLKAIVGELLGAEGPGAGTVAFAAACSNAVVQLTIGGDRALADAVHARLQSIAAASPDPAIAGYAARASGVRAGFGGDPGETLRHLRAAIAAFEAAGDLRNACSQKKTQGWYAGECGALEEGERALREAIEAAQRLGVANLVAHAKNDIGSPLVRLGKLAEAIRYQEEAIAAFAAQGDRRLESSAHGCLSWALRRSGDLEGALREARLALSTAPAAPSRVPASAFLAAALLQAGRAEEALSAVEEGLKALTAGASEEGEVTLRLAHAETLKTLGRDEQARSTITLARDAVMTLAQKISDAELRQSFLARIEENARTLDLATTWGVAAPAASA
ncbi:MAG: protein kinase [Byssovorax sp.]